MVKVLSFILKNKTFVLIKKKSMFERLRKRVSIVDIQKKFKGTIIKLPKWECVCICISAISV